MGFGCDAHHRLSTLESRTMRNLQATAPRACFRDPVPELFDAARYLDAAVSAHLSGHRALADELIRAADLPAVGEWTESLWGSKSPFVGYGEVSEEPPLPSTSERVPTRMPTTQEKLQLRLRDGYHCRFCGSPVIRREVRELMRKTYPQALRWGRTNDSQHVAFQAMWLQYDHVVPHARGGDNSLDNIVVTCAPCNFGRMDKLLDEVGLSDPRTRPAVRSASDGLERFR
jgi:5-methylcytosine-specific restriction endonuclease McrA